MMKAKFTVESLKHVRWGIEAELHAVTSGRPEDNEFCLATPSGKIALLVSNPVARDFLQLGKDYYVDFTQAPE